MHHKYAGISDKRSGQEKKKIKITNFFEFLFGKLKKFLKSKTVSAALKGFRNNQNFLLIQPVYL